MEFFSSIKKMMGKNTSLINCRDAYMNTKYGKNLSNEEILKNFINAVNELIKSKSMVTMNGDPSSASSYCCVVEIDEDVLPYKDEIRKFYSEKLGFGVAMLDSEILSKLGNENFGKGYNYMMLTWRLPSNMILENDEVRKIIDTSAGDCTHKSDNACHQLIDVEQIFE